MKLVERVLNAAGGGAGAANDAVREEIEQLVEAVHGHARMLALLAPALRERGVAATRESLVALMEEMEKEFPGSREKSVFASVELSLRRLSEANRDRVRVLGVFHGGVQLDMLRVMMQWAETDVDSLAVEMIETGIATPNRYNHLTLNPGLCPYLRGKMEAEEREALTLRWSKAMRDYVQTLAQKQQQKTEIAATLSVLDLPNLFALLAQVERAGEAEATTALASLLFILLLPLGKPRLLRNVAGVRDVAAKVLGGTWNHVSFRMHQTRIDERIAQGCFPEAYKEAQDLLQRAQAEGEQAYEGADLDVASSCFLLARVLQRAGEPGRALPLLDEAQRRFETIAQNRVSSRAERMTYACLSDRGGCLVNLDHLDEAARAYEESIRRADHSADERQIAVGQVELANIRSRQHRFSEALDGYEKALEWFTQLNEPSSVAAVWHQTGICYQLARQPEAAEDAYRKSLRIAVGLGNNPGQASTLLQLGTLYHTILDRLEEAVTFYRQAAQMYAELRDTSNEGGVRINFAKVLRELRRLEEARQELGRATECLEPLGQAGKPWMLWSELGDLEKYVGNSAAAAEAKRKAIACYLAYRRDGGGNYDAKSRFCLVLNQFYIADGPTVAASFLEKLAVDSDVPSNARTFIRAIQAIIGGSRDRTLADAPDLNYSMAAEILFRIETLEKTGK